MENGEAGCPFIGLVDDERTRFSFPSLAHRCRAARRPAAVDEATQGRYCLGPDSRACPRYPAGDDHAGATTRTVAPVRGPRSPLATEHARAPGRRRLPFTAARAAASATAAAMLVVIGVALLAAAGGGGGAAQGPAPVATASAPIQAAPVTPRPTASPTASPEPRPSPTPTPIATAATASPPTPVPASPPVVHRVRPGETLIAIAARYGVTVEAIVDANDIVDPRVIIVGQRLVIPQP